MISMMFLTAAFAGAPQVGVTDAGVVRGTAVVKNTPEAVLALLSNPTKVYAVSKGEGYVKVVADGDCLLTDEYHPHPVMEVRYALRVCPSGDTITSKLVRSEDIKVYSSVWRVTAAEGGALLEYELTVQPNLPLPSWVTNRATVTSVEDLFLKLTAHLESSNE